MLRRTFLGILAAIPFWRKNKMPSHERFRQYAKQNGGYRLYETKGVVHPAYDLHDGPTQYF
jgi:hypothetical protein